MALHLFNTLSGKVEEFQPLEDNLVRMYACGPTVYDYGHIGNFRTFIAVDVLRRFLKQSGYKLKHVMNITDVEDKIIRNAAQQGVTVQEYTQKYTKAFLEDADALSIERPEMLVKATDHIHEMAHFIAELRDKGYAYPTDDGCYYFRIAKFPEYGKLSKKDFAGMTDVLTSMSTRRTTLAILRCGRPPSLGKPSGKRKSALAAPVGTSSVRRCP